MSGSIKSGPGCTKPSHSQSLANFVANVHSQGMSATRTTIFSISFAKLGVQETVLLVNHALARGTPAIFVVSRVRAAKPLFYWLECRFVIFAIFVKTPFLWWDQSTVYQKHRFRDPEKPFAFASEFVRNASFAAFNLRFGGSKFASEFSGRVGLRIRIRGNSKTVL